jgi:hypothetical protein
MSKKRTQQLPLTPIPPITPEVELNRDDLGDEDLEADRCADGGAHDWEVLSADPSQMSDGQASDYFAGMWRPAACRKCGLLTTLEAPGDFMEDIEDGF